MFLLDPLVKLTAPALGALVRFVMRSTSGEYQIYQMSAGQKAEEKRIGQIPIRIGILTRVSIYTLSSRSALCAGFC